MERSPKFSAFSSPTDHLGEPEAFTYPFFYVPHPLVELAAEELRVRLEKDPEAARGLESGNAAQTYGKMLGVLVVRSAAGELGYLSAFSGKYATGKAPDFFVPPVADIHTEDSYYKAGERELNAMTAEIERQKSDPDFLQLKSELEQQRTAVALELSAGRELLKHTKKERQREREQAREQMSEAEFEVFNAELTRQSIAGQIAFKHHAKRLKDALEALEAKAKAHEADLAALEQARREKSNELQRWIFDQYNFQNAHGETQSLTAIFPDFETQQPPSGAGDCCAPKLLQYAYLNGYQPLCMGEFWWGGAPKNEVRKAGHFYPSCNSRCRPILGHMLDGLRVEDNPLLTWSDALELPIIYDDEALVIVNKPAGMLSVPGKDIEDSALSRILELYPDATGSVLLHRLDMSTSGILIFTKTAKAHKFMQRQFIRRTLKKRYIAIVDGNIAGERGTIDLPLRPDYYDLPRQMVCHELGKEATTHWEVLERKAGRTRLALYPVSGRTHQLRVHCAHPDGLNTPILGDELYGIARDRLHLHAERITFVHPISREEVTFSVEPNF